MQASVPVLLLASSVDFITAIKDNDFFGKTCLAVLVGLSIFSLTLIFSKLSALWAAKRHSRAFQRLVDSDGSWETLFLASKRYKQSPIARLLKETYVECRLENWFDDNKTPLDLDQRLEVAKASIEATLHRAMASEEMRLQSKLTALATISTLAPFIGLFGTVWGVLGSFQALGREGSAALTALAPGISTALMTTIFGLLAAIPALIAYNFCAREVHKLIGSMESFSHAIENAVRKKILLQEKRQR